MRRIRESLTSALAGVSGLALDERALWPDMVLGVLLAFALLFSWGSSVTLVFDFTFLVSTVAALLLILLSSQKKAVFGASLVLGFSLADCRDY